MSVKVRATGWKAIPFGPWERHGRDIDGGRRVIVASLPGGRWTWDLWSMLDYPVYLVPGDDFATVQEAMDDADRAAAEWAAVADDELGARNGVDAYVGLDILKIVTVGGVKGCVMCRNDIAPGSAVLEAEDGWLWCGSCASRNPGAVLDDGSAG